MKYQNDYKLLNLCEVEQEFGIGISMLKKLIMNREIAVVKVGAKNHIKFSDVVSYIDSRTIGARC